MSSGYRSARQSNESQVIKQGIFDRAATAHEVPAPRSLRCDNGPEFRSRYFNACAQAIASPWNTPRRGARPRTATPKASTVCARRMLNLNCLRNLDDARDRFGLIFLEKANT